MSVVDGDMWSTHYGSTIKVRFENLSGFLQINFIDETAEFHFAFVEGVFTHYNTNLIYKLKLHWDYVAVYF